MITMMLLCKSIVLSLFLVVGSHADEVRPRGTGGGGNLYTTTPTYSSLPFPTKAPTTTPAPSSMKTDSPIPFPTKAPTTAPAPSLTKSEPPISELVSSISPTRVALTPDEVSFSSPSSALQPVAECLARSRNSTDLSRLDFLVTMTVQLSDSVVPFLFRLSEFLQTFMVADMLGCGLRVHDTSPIRDVQFDLSVNNSTLASNSSCINCTDIQIYVDIYYEGWNASRINEELFDTLTTHCARIASIAGVEEISDTCRYMSILGPDGTIQFLDNLLNPPEGTDGDLLAHKESISTLGVMALSFSALTILLGVLVATKRRKRKSVKQPEANENHAEYMTNDSEAGSSSSESSCVVKGDTTVYPSDMTVSDGTADGSLLLGSLFVVEESESVTSSWSGISSRSLASNMYQESTAPATRDEFMASAVLKYYHGLPGRVYRSPDTVQL